MSGRGFNDHLVNNSDVDVNIILNIAVFLTKSPNLTPGVINNGNCTEWRAIWSEIKRVITKSHDRVAGVRFVITSLISDQNCPTRSAITTLLYSF